MASAATGPANSPCERGGCWTHVSGVTPRRLMPRVRLFDATATPAEPLPSNAGSSRGVPSTRSSGGSPTRVATAFWPRSICPANSPSRPPQPSQKTRGGRTIAMDFAEGSQGAESCYKGGAATMGVLRGLPWLRRTSSHPRVDSLMSRRGEQACAALREAWRHRRI